MRQFITRSVFSLIAITGFIVAFTTSANAELLTFLTPDKATVEQSGDFSATFTLEPVESGMARIVSRTLKRVLKNKMEGYAIVSMIIPGISHLKERPQGVTETVREIRGNLTKVRFKQQISGTMSETVYVNIRGQETLTARDIGSFTSAFEVVNPDYVIAHMEPSTNFEISLQIEFGQGTLSLKKNKLINPAPGEFGVKAIFNPVERVDSEVQSFINEEGTGYERLVIDITTDGTSVPEAMMIDAASAIKQFFHVLSKPVPDTK